MLCGTAFKNKGVQKMLDAVIELMPSPVDIPPVKGILENESEGERRAADDEAFSALAFKIMTDPFVGQLIFFRVYSGVINSGDTVYNPVKGRKERLGRILQMHANQREEIKEVRAGDIAAAVGLKEATTGDTLCDPQKVITLERMVFPEPVIHVAVEPKTKADQEKMGLALGRLAQEDPSFRVRTDEESGQTIISGMGELHLEILVDRMRREFNVEATVGAPQVAYRECIKKAVEQEGKFVKQSGGRGQFGHVWLKIEPNEAGKGYEFIDAIKGGVVPREFIPAVDKGLQDAISSGVLAGFPVGQSLADKQAAYDSLVATAKNALRPIEQIRTDIAATEKAAAEAASKVPDKEKLFAQLQQAAPSANQAIGPAQAAVAEREKALKTLIESLTSSAAAKVAELTKQLAQQNSEVGPLREASKAKAEGSPERAEADNAVKTKEADTARTQAALDEAKKAPRAEETAEAKAALAELAKARETLDKTRAAAKDASEKLAVADKDLAGARATSEQARAQLAELKKKEPETVKSAETARVEAEKALPTAEKELATAKAEAEKRRSAYEAAKSGGVRSASIDIPPKG